MDTRAGYTDSWLTNKQPPIEVLAIFGMGGSGKTTLAKYVYNSNLRNFESSSFLEDIGKICEQPHGLLELQKQLLTDILGGKKIRIRNVSEGTSKIEEALQKKIMLIVLDDIDEHDQLASLLGRKKINTESKIIITTRVQNIDTWLYSTSWTCRMYEPNSLIPQESFEFLSRHVFGCQMPLESPEELIQEAAHYCGGNPLALRVLGSSLCSATNNIEYWKSTLSLHRKDLHSRIQLVLQRSFDSLPYRSYKELFLHIACFFIGEDEDYVVKILEPDYCATAGVITLINRCLLTVSPTKKLMMHRLLQDMGRTIIREEFPENPAKRNRVWCNQESYALLRKGKGSKRMKGLALNIQMLKEEFWAPLKADSLTKMDNLELLQLKYVQLIGSYGKFPDDLRLLCWHGSRLQIIPSRLFMGNLVDIDLSYSNLELFEPPKVLESLKILNLKDSHNLYEIRNISRLPNLETLILWNCSSLDRVCETIRDLNSLALLNMTGCENISLEYTGPQQPLFSLPNSLERLLLDSCNLHHDNALPVNPSVQSLLLYLNLGNNLFEFLPDFNHLENLRVLDLTCCRRLKYLLCLPRRLQELYTYYCESLEKITFQSHQFTLRQIGYGGCFNLSEIEGLFKLVPISKLDDTDLGHMKWLKEYQNHEVGLIGEEITEGRSRHIQMLYEFGIMSTFLPGIKDPKMTSE